MLIVLGLPYSAGDLYAGTLDRNSLAVVINIDDPDSLALGRFYGDIRKLPRDNIIRVSLGWPEDALSGSAAAKLHKELEKKTPDNVQAYALAWSRPYKAGCMSITTAVSFGYDTSFCASGCERTRRSGYFDSPAGRPYDDYGFRPSMMLAGGSLEESMRLVRRGIESDYSRPRGKVLLMNTSDKNRNVRSIGYRNILKSFGSILDVNILDADWTDTKVPVFMYFTGLKTVRYIDRLQFQPGAIADHLTSTGGVLFGGNQMSVLKWIEAGVTASYGTVVEPCNFLQKFPAPGVLISHYLNGDSLIEAYWKSVEMPGQGLFVGEPLASPYKGCELLYSGKDHRVRLVNRPAVMPMKERASCSN